jgi:hypothetical protein
MTITSMTITSMSKTTTTTDKQVKNRKIKEIQSCGDTQLYCLMRRNSLIQNRKPNVSNIIVVHMIFCN